MSPGLATTADAPLKRRRTAPTTSMSLGNLFQESPRTYRPPHADDEDRSRGPGLDDRGSSTGNPWDGRDLIGAVALSITAIVFVLFTGGFVDVLADNSGHDSAFGTFVVSAISLALSVAIATLTRLPRAATVNVLALAATANVLIHITSGSGESDLLGLPPALLESAILSGLPVGVSWLYISRRHDRSFRKLGFAWPATAFAFAIAIGAWVLAYIGAITWSLLVADIEAISPPDNTTVIFEIAGGSIALAWLLAGLWGPVAEEIFFRGFLLGGLRSRLSAWPAILISSGVFALFHISPGLYVPTFLMGVAVGWVYLKTRSIWPSIFVHALHNSLALLIVWHEIG